MVDLHTHSTASDGSLSPAKLVHLAQERGLCYLALTDHNTANGLSEFLCTAKCTSIYPIPGVEISCEQDGEELHILALNLPESSFAQIQSLMVEVLRRSEESKRNLVDNLRRAGYSICYEDIQKENPGSAINRAHIGVALQKAGYVPTVKAAFQTLLNEEAGYYYPAKRLQAIETLSIIQDLKAISVWAHPFFKLNTESIKRFLEILVPSGLKAMETYYSTYTPAQTNAALELAKQFHLKLSGGSDFHGTSKPDIQLGSGLGNLNIPDRVAEELLEIKV